MSKEASRLSNDEKKMLELVKVSKQNDKEQRNRKSMTFSYQIFENPIIYKFSISGACAVITNTILAPIERIKTILQTNNISLIQKKSKFNTPFEIYAQIARDQGILSYYRGNMSNVYKYSLQSFAKIYMYERFVENSKIHGKSNETSFVYNLAINTIITLI